MKIHNPQKTVIVFDLDDTLYAEYEYKQSGIQSVVNIIAHSYPEFDAAHLMQHIQPDDQDWLDKLCQHCQLNESEKQSLLWQYRLHQPALTPYCTPEFLENLCHQFAASALITDGRSLTQRLKIKALGFQNLFDMVLISEAYCSEKPADKRFKIIQETYQATCDNFIYIGDNIKKDFITPNQMGWITIGLQASAHNIHQYHPADFAQEYHPQHWIQSLDELTTLIPS